MGRLICFGEVLQSRLGKWDLLAGWQTTELVRPMSPPFFLTAIVGSVSLAVDGK